MITTTAVPCIACLLCRAAIFLPAFYLTPHHATLVLTFVAAQIPGLTSYVGGLVSSLSTLEAPSAILAATEGIGLAALGLGKEAHIDLLYKSQVRRDCHERGLPVYVI